MILPPINANNIGEFPFLSGQFKPHQACCRAWSKKELGGVVCRYRRGVRQAAGNALVESGAKKRSQSRVGAKEDA
jgi:hypothetical protein